MELSIVDTTLKGALPAKPAKSGRRRVMQGLIYLVGLVVVIMAILSFFGMR